MMLRLLTSILMSITRCIDTGCKRACKTRFVRISCVVFVLLVVFQVGFHLGKNEILALGTNSIKEFNTLETSFSNDSTSNMNKNSNISTVKKLLVELSGDIRKINLYARGVKARKSAHQALLHIKQLLELTNTTTEGLRRKTTKSKNICGEVFMIRSFGDPLYYEGFKYMNCTYGSPLDKLVSIVVLNRNRNIRDMSQFVHNIRQYNKNIKIIVGVSNLNSINNATMNENSLLLKAVPSTYSEGKAWNFLIQEVSTEFTLVAQNITYFSDDVRIDRLVSVLERLNVSVAGGASRDLKGFWKLGCYQSAYQNYSLVYEEGYFESKYECIFCDYMIAPFLVRTKILAKYKFDEQLPHTSVFHDFFLRLTENDEESVVCPDSMFYTYHEMSSKNQMNWFKLAKKYNLYQIKFADEFHITFNCTELKAECKKESGYALHPCCIQELTDIVKLFMTVCKNSNIICELQFGTLLGAVKFGKTLPWELDADICFFASNFWALVGCKAMFEKQYKFEIRISKTGWTVDIKSAHWRLEAFGLELIDSQSLLETGLTPTKVIVDGQWVYGARNPGMRSRNVYGQEIYAHSQHLNHLGKKNLTTVYKRREFTRCKSPGRHDCLDNFNADGNFQFQVPLA